MKVPTLALFVLYFLAPVSSAQGKVWVVDALNLPGANFLDIQPAVDAASDGDVILIRGRIGESYGGAIIANRSLTIAGQLDNSTPFPTQLPPVVGPIWIQNLGSNQRVTLRGLFIGDAIPSPLPFQPNLTLTGCAGKVFVESVSMNRGLSTPTAVPVAPSLNVANSSRVTIVHSSGTGSRGTAGAIGGQSAVLFNSIADLHYSQFLGGSGSPVSGDGAGVIQHAAPGGEAMLVLGSDVTAVASAFFGGSGGRGIEDAAMNCYPSADGGPGIVVGFTAIKIGTLTEIDSSLFGGMGGGAPGVNCPAGQDGEEIVIAGSHTVLPADAVEFLTNSPVREGETLQVKVRGTPGAFTFIFVGALVDPVLDPLAFDGLVHISTPILRKFVGKIPGAGELTRQFVINELGIGTDAVNVDMQALTYSASPGGFRLSAANPSSVLLLDGSF